MLPTSWRSNVCFRGTLRTTDAGDGTDHGVVVVGGGPAASASAIALARAGLRVTLVAPSPTERTMSETVPPDVQPLLATLGAWDRFVLDDHPPARRACSAWGHPELSWRDAFAEPAGGGWHVDRSAFDAGLLEAAERSGVETLLGRTMTALLRSEGKVRGVIVRDEAGAQRTLAASFVVDASGRRAVVARPSATSAVRADHLTSVFAMVPQPPEGLHTIVVEAVEHGWWFLAPEGPRDMVVGFFSDADVVRELSVAGAAGWLHLLERTTHVSKVVEPNAVPDRLRTRSAASRCTVPAYGPGWVAAGDAASAWDPLTSSGVMWALRSGMEAADVTLASLAGDHQPARAYDRRVRARFARYLLERRAFYGIERRWSEARFWRRRQRPTRGRQGPVDGTPSVNEAAATAVVSTGAHWDPRGCSS